MRIHTLSLILAVLNCTAFCAQTTDTIDVKRINEIAATLEVKPSGAGQPITNRPFWEKLGKDPAFQSQISAADKLRTDPIPAIADDLFLEFSKNGNRSNYEKAAFTRRNKLTPLVLAECLKNNGTYLAKINELVNALCKERTWVLPAHDKGLTNFNNTTVTIDLFSSNLAWQLAQTDYMLADRLDPETRTNLRREVFRRVIDPFRAMIRNERKADWWLTGDNNWNPVCLSGATGAGLIELSDPKDRAEFVAAAEHYSRYFLDGFTADGYCSEGVGYWNYGFGMYAAMAENFRIATHGKVDLFSMDGAAMPATYGARIGIINGVVPAFADCALNASPSTTLLWLLNRTYNWNQPQYANLDTNGIVRSLFEAMLFEEAQSRDAAPLTGVDLSNPAGPRTYFEDAGIYIGRPDPVSGKADDFAVAFKGGNNGESHNHNDLGSYVVVLGSVPILLDPGPETYTKRTFSAQRYDSKLLNSYGHSVPVVGGELQQACKKFKAKILSHTFSDTTDTVVMDLTKPYKVRGLKKLTRTFEYGRASRVFMITDEVEFDKPQTFETAMISLGEFTGKLAPDAKTGVLRITQGAAKVNVALQATAAIGIITEPIKENSGAKPNRLAVKFVEPVTSAIVRLTVTPGL